jgi:hypothetical protein
LLSFTLRDRGSRWPLGTLLVGAVLLLCRPAAAFCKATTCDAASSVACPLDASGCVTGGHPLSWATGCISFAVDEAGSPKRGISYQAFDDTVRIALQQWLAVDCGDGKHPSIALWDAGDFAGPLVCDEPEYSQEGPNANAWILRDTDWPYTGADSTFGHTTITFEASTGRILDADVELDSFGLELTTSDDAIVDDLQSIATHEAGHFLGLADSMDPDATMSATYSPASRKARSLSADDRAAICSLYPPSRDVPSCSDPSPNHGFSRYCAASGGHTGCAVARPAGGRSLGALLGAFATAVCAARRARRSPRAGRSSR